MAEVAKILILSFVGDYPETAPELHKQIQEEMEPSCTLEHVEQNLTELAKDSFIYTAERPDGTAIFWR